MLEQFVDFPRAIRRLRKGLFGEYVDVFAETLATEGYVHQSVWIQLKIIGRLDRWLVQHGYGLAELDEQRADEFLDVWKRAGLSRPGDVVAIRRFVAYLRGRGVINRPLIPVEPSEVERLCRRYEKFLHEERGLSPQTFVNYWPHAEALLVDRFGSGPLELKALTAAEVSDFVVRYTAVLARGRMRTMPAALRSFLHFLFQKEKTAIDLAAAVPTIAQRPRTAMPKYLPTEDVERLLASCDRSTPAGRRDYAIFLLLARLGLRAGEVTALELDHINWRAGEILVHGKGGLHDRLPLLPDVGAALADYIKRDRPKCPARRVFIRMVAPHVGFKIGSALNGIVKRALERAGIEAPTTGPHLFRHSLATSMLRGGASMVEIGEMLRHRSPTTTEIYAKIDFATLRALARPWPIGGGGA